LENVTRGISQEEIEFRSESFTINNVNNLLEENKICAICQFDFENGNFVRKLTIVCTHLFHRDCIDEWLRNQQHTCPICRKDLMEFDS